MHLFFFVLRNALYVVATLVVLFIGYLLTMPITAGYQEAERAYERAPELLAEREDLIRRQGELLQLMQQAAQEASTQERSLQAAQSGYRSLQAAQMGVVQELDHARSLAGEQREALILKSTQVQNLFGLDLPTMPSDPQGMSAWVTNARRQADQVCGFQWADLTEFNRLSGLVASNLSQACGSRQAVFSTMQQTADAWASAHRALAATQGRMDDAQQRIEEMSGRIEDLTARFRGAEDTQMEHEAQLSRLEAELVHNQQELQAVESATDSAAGWVAGMRAHFADYEDWLWVKWNGFWPYGLGVLILAWSMPYVGRAFNFYVIAPLMMRARPIQFSFSDDALAAAAVTHHSSERTLQVELSDGEGIFVRPDHVRQVQSGRSRTRWLLDSESFGQSWLFGFVGLTEVRQPANEEGTTRVTIAATDRDAADTYVMRVDLVDHPGFIIQPKHVVALSDGLVLGAQWRWGLQAWMRLQFRYIMVRGTGSIWLEGYGDVFAEDVGALESHQDSSAYVAWDGRLKLRLRRRETAWHYIRGKMNLYETGMSGDGTFVWQKSGLPTGRSGLERSFDALWSALGKLLGF